MTRDSPRRPHTVTLSSREDLLDHAADVSMDAVDFGGVDADEAADALEEAARELRQYGEGDR